MDALEPVLDYGGALIGAYHGADVGGEAGFAQENKEWLRVYQLPAYAPDMNPAEGIWSLLKRSITNFAAADQAWSASSSAS